MIHTLFISKTFCLGLLIFFPVTRGHWNTRPVSLRLVTERPVTQGLVNEKPVTQRVETEEPETGSLLTEEPVTQKFVIQEPVALRLLPEEPTTQELLTKDLVTHKEKTPELHTPGLTTLPVPVIKSWSIQNNTNVVEITMKIDNNSDIIGYRLKLNEITPKYVNKIKHVAGQIIVEKEEVPIQASRSNYDKKKNMQFYLLAHRPKVYIKNLKNNTVYEFTLSAFSKKSEGKPTSPIRFKMVIKDRKKNKVDEQSKLKKKVSLERRKVVEEYKDEPILRQYKIDGIKAVQVDKEDEDKLKLRKYKMDGIKAAQVVEHKDLIIKPKQPVIQKKQKYIRKNKTTTIKNDESECDISLENLKKKLQVTTGKYEDGDHEIAKKRPKVKNTSHEEGCCTNQCKKYLKKIETSQELSQKVVKKHVMNPLVRNIIKNLLMKLKQKQGDKIQNETNTTVVRDEVKQNETNLTEVLDQVKKNETNLTEVRDEVKKTEMNLTEARDEVKKTETNLTKARDEVKKNEMEAREKMKQDERTQGHIKGLFYLADSKKSDKELYEAKNESNGVELRKSTTQNNDAEKNTMVKVQDMSNINGSKRLNIIRNTTSAKMRQNVMRGENGKSNHLRPFDWVQKTPRLELKRYKAKKVEKRPNITRQEKAFEMKKRSLRAEMKKHKSKRVEGGLGELEQNKIEKNVIRRERKKAKYFSQFEKMDKMQSETALGKLREVSKPSNSKHSDTMVTAEKLSKILEVDIKRGNPNQDKIEDSQSERNETTLSMAKQNLVQTVVKQGKTIQTKHGIKNTSQTKDTQHESNHSRMKKVKITRVNMIPLGKKLLEMYQNKKSENKLGENETSQDKPKQSDSEQLKIKQGNIKAEVILEKVEGTKLEINGTKQDQVQQTKQFKILKGDTVQGEVRKGEPKQNIPKLNDTKRENETQSKSKPAKKKEGQMTGAEVKQGEAKQNKSEDIQTINNKNIQKGIEQFEMKQDETNQVEMRIDNKEVTKLGEKINVWINFLEFTTPIIEEVPDSYDY